jgi:hypothetical protein
MPPRRVRSVCLRENEYGPVDPTPSHLPTTKFWQTVGETPQAAPDQGQAKPLNGILAIDIA